MRLTLKIWRQPDAVSAGAMHTYELADVSPDMSFLEMLDVLNERLIEQNQLPTGLFLVASGEVAVVRREGEGELVADDERLDTPGVLEDYSRIRPGCRHR